MVSGLRTKFYFELLPLWIVMLPGLVSHVTRLDGGGMSRKEIPPSWWYCHTFQDAVWTDKTIDGRGGFSADTLRYDEVSRM